MWKINQNVLLKEDGGLIEIPIFTCEISGFRKGLFLIERFRKNLRLKPSNCAGHAMSSLQKSKFKKTYEILKAGFRMFNFSDATTASEMKWFARKALKKYEKEQGSVPIVMIGHPKTFANAMELKEFLFWCSQKSNISFTTYKEYINET